LISYRVGQSNVTVWKNSSPNKYNSYNFKYISRNFRCIVCHWKWCHVYDNHLSVYSTVLWDVSSSFCAVSAPALLLQFLPPCSSLIQWYSEDDWHKLCSCGIIRGTSHKRTVD
jgi:thymidylate synthase